MYVGSRCCESTRTFTAGYVRRISAAATRPSSAFPGGMRTSTIATFGAYERTLRSRSSASTARPTTSWPASVRSDAIPSRSSALSSATTTRRRGVAPSVSCASGVASAVAMEVIVDAQSLQRVEHDVAQILAQTEAPVEPYGATRAAIGRSLGWELGAVWEVGPDDRRLRCVCTWHAGHGAPEFEALSERLTLERGEGLPGGLLVSGRPSWIVDTPNDRNFPRADAARRAGLQAAFGFPLLSPRGVVGAMEFFSRDLREPDAQLLETMSVIGSQVGQFVVRRHAEAEVRASESRLRAMLEAALDAVVVMDHRGRVSDWNHPAEATFGYRAHEAIGRDMADLIVPPRLRPSHRKGLARFLETERGVVLDKRLELAAVHKNGAEFPVELTITRIGLPGPPTFTGYLRDISDRKRTEAELRASRARLVEVADAERRRIQRNLHDGAQQRLTAVLLNLGRLREGPEERAALLDAAIDELATGLQELRELPGAPHPAVLSERGLVAALKALALRAPVPVDLRALPDERLPEQLE